LLGIQSEGQLAIWLEPEKGARPVPILVVVEEVAQLGELDMGVDKLGLAAL
jgi:hypothetical protein